jgi:GNAT superfamily N-acetyltransferase
MVPGITIRHSRESQIARCLIDWAGQEGWNPSPHDAEAFFAADPDGWWIAEDATGAPLGGLSLVHAEDGGFAFLGLYIVRPDWRGKGVGISLWTAALEASPARCVGLDGVVAQQENYARSGFVLAFQNQRMRFTPQHLAGLSAEGLVPLAEVPFDALCALDRAVAYPAGRETFLKGWITPPGGAALALLKGGILSGYGVVRPCLSGHKIGPLVADGADDALRLLAGLAEAVGLEEGYLDISHANPAAVEMTARRGMESVFETARMYRGEAPAALDLSRLWGVTTFELG